MLDDGRNSKHYSGKTKSELRKLNVQKDGQKKGKKKRLAAIEMVNVRAKRSEEGQTGEMKMDPRTNQQRT